MTRVLALADKINYRQQMSVTEPLAGNIFAIKRYALHDGPDLRVTIFFKGCPLSCLWCHNPEGLNFGKEILTQVDRCVGCGACQASCPTGALSQGPHWRDHVRCTVCGICAQVCPALAHECIGQTLTVAQVMAEIAKEAPFFEGTSGGVTFSGGEPLAQPDFLLALLRACGQRGWHRAVDTSAWVSWEIFQKILKVTDIFLIDLKHMDACEHKKLTGVDNVIILDNARRLAHSGAKIYFRMPLIPGLNDQSTNLEHTAEFILSLPIAPSIDLLPYHGTAKNKYMKLGRDYPGENLHTADHKAISQAAALFQRRGLTVRIGG
jgi:pyruvate formate lyase activating enzyme